MKRIEAVIEPFEIDEAKAALDQIGVPGLTVVEVRISGGRNGHAPVHRGAEYDVEFLPQLKVEVLIDDAGVDDVVDALTIAARIGDGGHGHIFVTPVVDVVRIRTGERGASAV